ncbi:hypothetical protein GCM10009557_09780 [Virgisporangium ochraceum]
MTGKQENGRPRRRRVLGGLGATGLAAAVAVFGRSGPAAAKYNVACCHLEYAPTRTISSCLSGRRCQCCEVKDPYGATVASAYSCN